MTYHKMSNGELRRLISLGWDVWFVTQAEPVIVDGVEIKGENTKDNNVYTLVSEQNFKDLPEKLWDCQLEGEIEDLEIVI